MCIVQSALSQRLPLFCVQLACVACGSDVAGPLEALRLREGVNPKWAHHSHLYHPHDRRRVKINLLKVSACEPYETFGGGWLIWKTPDSSHAALYAKRDDSLQEGGGVGHSPTGTDVHHCRMPGCVVLQARGR
ncbi:hypothetical protein E2C01_085631 [Portunus trituberculatus]|uniref:Secreted protein n=1 Tax=Portunus trituberculatus TaxID=210409 RepID=A0A5B7JE64_PORTR|nr:hypothetical protein [Portunus trituberculatus]